jgi:hypothetical protein
MVVAEVVVEGRIFFGLLVILDNLCSVPSSALYATP